MGWGRDHRKGHKPRKLRSAYLPTVQFKVVTMRSGKPLRAPPRLLEVVCVCAVCVHVHGVCGCVHTRACMCVCVCVCVCVSSVSHHSVMETTNQCRFPQSAFVFYQGGGNETDN